MEQVQALSNLRSQSGGTSLITYLLEPNSSI